MDKLRARLLARLDEAPQHAREASSDFDLTPGTGLPEHRKLRPAGVLIGVDGSGRVILTKRSARLRHHPGQVAFPGGKVDPGDDGPIGAAIREAGEEIGLPAPAAKVIGTLPPHETVTGFQVTPVLARIGPFDERPEAGEVDEIFRVPLTHLGRVKNFSVESRIWKGYQRAYYTVPFGPYYIWGATARILYSLAQTLDVDT